MLLITKYRLLPQPVKATLWFLACGVLQKGIGTITIPVFTRILTTEEYGLYTLFNSWLELLGVIITLRLSFGVFMQGLVRYDRDKDEYTSALQGLTTLLTLVALLVYIPFREFWNGLTSLNTFLMLSLFASIWATAMFGFWSVRQREQYKYRALVAVTLTVSLIAPVSGILAVLSTTVFKVEARVLTLVIVEVVVYGAMFVYYMVKGRRLFVREYWIQALKFNIPLVPHYLSQSALNQADRVMINSIVGASAAGIYGLANSVAWIMTVVSQALMNSLNPWLYKRIRQNECDRIGNVAYVAIAVVGAANLFLIALAPEIIYLFAPAQYQEAVWLIPPLASSAFLIFMYDMFAVFEFYFERTKLVAFASMVGALVNIALNAVFIPLLGYVTAAYTTLISYFVFILMHYAFMRKIQRREMNGFKVYDLKILMAICIAYGLLAALIAALFPFPLARAGVCLILIAVAIVKRDALRGSFRGLFSRFSG